MNRRLWCIAILILVAFGCAHAPQPAADPERPSDEELRQKAEQQLKDTIDKLVRQLASEFYKEREDADRELRKLLEDLQHFDTVLSHIRSKLAAATDAEVQNRLQRMARPYLKFGITASLLTDFPGILARLTSGDEVVCFELIEELNDSKHPDAVGPLAALSEDRDSDVSERAITVLAEIKDSRVIEPLIKALSHKSDEVCRIAASALGEMRDPRAVEPLIKSLSREGGEVCRTAACALGDIKDPRAVKPLIKVLASKNNYEVISAQWALRQIGDASVGPLIDALSAPGVPLRIHAGYVLGQMKEPRAVEPFIKALSDADASVRGQAAWGLGEIRDPRAVEPLIKATSDPVYSVRGFAVRSLGCLWDKRAIEPLVKALADPDWETLRGAQEELPRYGRAVVEPVIKMLSHEASTARRAAAYVLGGIRDSRAVEPLIRLLGDKDKEVRSWAAWALGWIGDAVAVAPLLKGLAGLSGEELEMRIRALGQLGDTKALEPLSKLLTSADSEVRAAAIYALGGIGDARSLEHFVKALNDPEEQVRSAAVSALGRIKDEKAVGPLIKALEHPDPSVAFAAAEALGSIGDRRAIEPLAAALSNGNLTAAEALARFGDERAIDPLVKALDNDYYTVRQGAAEGLVRIGGPKVAERLIDILNDKTASSASHWVIIQALGEMREKSAVKPLRNYLDAIAGSKLHPHPRVRIQIMGALASIGQEEMAEKLLEIARDPKAEMRSDAAHALGEIGDERAIDLLIGLCLGSKEGELYAAIEVLRKFGKKGLDALQQAFEKEKNFARKFKLKDIHHFLSKK